MSNPLLDVQNISVSIPLAADKGGGARPRSLLRHLSLQAAAGETHVVMGPNGAGKSTLGNALMGNPVYHIDEGRIFFDGKDITDMKADARARAGLFMSFQNPIEIPGISLESFIRSGVQAVTGEKVKLFAFQKRLRVACASLKLDASFTERDLNVGFSGGERKKAEVLQLIMLCPRLAILDETDSGLDVDAVRTVSAAVGKWQEETGGALIIITHSTRILECLKVDCTHVLQDGRIVKSGGADMVDVINEKGFEAVL